MERRKFIIGAGALATGSSAAMGTGAFSAMSAEREANINVVNDGSGLVALTPGEHSGSIVSESDNSGELTIDFTAGGNAGGVNVNSRYQVGYFGEKYGWMAPEEALGDNQGDPYAESAFEVINQDTDAHSITIDYEFTEDPGNARVFLMASTRQADVEATSGTNIPKRRQWYSAEENGSLVFDNDDLDHRLSSGGKIGVSILVDTRDSSTEIDLSGTLAVRSN